MSSAQKHIGTAMTAVKDTPKLTNYAIRYVNIANYLHFYYVFF